MAKREDGRFKRSEERLLDALVALLERKSLAEIGVSELAREARVSRATFYAHYQNTSEAYEQLVMRMMEDVQTFEQHFDCTGRRHCSAIPYCEKIRSSSRYACVAREPRFSSVVLRLYEDAPSSSLKRRLLDIGLPETAADAITLFQMSGCHAVAVSDAPRSADWEQTRMLIDRFIEGGVQALSAIQNCPAPGPEEER